jgi:hypothetical protein
MEGMNGKSDFENYDNEWKNTLSFQFMYACVPNLTLVMLGTTWASLGDAFPTFRNLG